MSYVAENVYAGGGSTNTVLVCPFGGCSVVINGRRITKATSFTCVDTLTISFVYNGSGAVCTWGTPNKVEIVSGGVFAPNVGWIDSNIDESEPLVLKFIGSTPLAIIPYGVPLIPVFCGLDNTTKSYKIGSSDSEYEEVTASDLCGGYTVSVVSVGSRYNHVFDVVPADSNASTAIMKYNSASNIFYPDADDTPIPTYSNYDDGQVVSGRDSSWYARWITVKCTGAAQTVPPSQGVDWSSVVKYDSTYNPRTTEPATNNPYYIQVDGGGYNPCILGNNKIIQRPTYWSVLPNCVGYAVGRFNEIGDYGWCQYLVGRGNAENFIEIAEAEGLEISQNPSLGACMVWKHGDTLSALDSTYDSAGHVAIVEAINEDGTILISQSGWSARSPMWTETIRYGDGDWHCSFMNYLYTFRGFIKNPAVGFNGPWNSNTDTNYPAWRDNTQDNSTEAEELRRQLAATQSGKTVVYRYEKEVVGTINDLHGMKLLTTPTLVESPFIEVKIGDYTFGSFTREGSPERVLSETRVTYPNYIDSLRIVKINGAINQYTLTMSYQIREGDDPNLIDKVLGSVSDSRKIVLTYGDWNSPSFIYKNEEALITKVTSNVDFQQSRIRYTLTCTSASVSLKSKTYMFSARAHTKPSTVIRELLSNSSYGLLDIFYGMKNNSLKVEQLGLIPSDDQEVDIKAQSYIDVLTYLNYLVSCMASSSSQNSDIKDSAYYLIMKDEISGELDGPYFQIVKVNTQLASISSSRAYEVDIGFPDNTLVLNFQINDDNSWAILYKYAESVNQEQYVYKIDDYGRLYTEKTPNIMMSNVYYEATEANKTWWTKMTQFPISATLTIKGLVRPSMLMDYVKVNALFYGRRHASSGLYVITRQEDIVDRSGYKTTLSLTRISGDEDELYSLKRTEVLVSERVNRDETHTSPRGKNANDPVQTTNQYTTPVINPITSVPGVEESPYDDTVESNDSTDSTGRSRDGNGNIGGGYTGGQITGSELTPKYEARKEHEEGSLVGKHKP